MDTYLVTPENIVLLFPAGESFEPKRAVADCLRQNGLTLWSDMEAEAFSLHGWTLLMARPTPPSSARVGSACPRLSRR